MDSEVNRKGIISDLFPPVSAKEWEDKILLDLKGGGYEENLVWETHDHYRIRPYYRSEDLSGIGYLESIPGQVPYLRGSETKDNNWYIRQDILVLDPESANREAREILAKGATSIGFNFLAEGGPSDKTGNLPSEENFNLLLSGLPLEEVPINFILDGNFREILGLIHSFAIRNDMDPEKITGSISLNPLGRLAAMGNFRRSLDEDFSELADCLKFSKNQLPLFRIINNSGNVIHESGASVTQVLAYTLAMGSEYLIRLTGMGLSPGEILNRMQFRFSIGSSYFMEIAKLRAARYLWSRIIEAFPSSPENPPAMFIQSMTSRWNQTIYDPHVNILRGATESMSAILGGSDSLTVTPFDQTRENYTDISIRIARNTQIVLKEESYLDKVVDPAGGSYYIENLTDALITGAWKLFLTTEEKGGFLQSLIDGFIQETVESTASYRLMNLATRKEKLLGTNRYPIQDEVSGTRTGKKKNPAGTGPAESLSSSGSIPAKEKTMIVPLKSFRASVEFDTMRIKTENHPGKKPVVFIIPLGNLSVRRARAMFTMNFFACAGFRVIDNIGTLSTVHEGVLAARKAKADIVVLCSSDDEYPGMVGDFVSGTGSDLIAVIAGNPEKHSELIKNTGIQHFIHEGSNLLEELKNYQKLLGIIP